MPSEVSILQRPLPKTASFFSTMHVADYIVPGFLIASMLLAAAFYAWRDCAFTHHLMLTVKLVNGLTIERTL
jgi:hypothetical protein